MAFSEQQNTRAGSFFQKPHIPPEYVERKMVCGTIKQAILDGRHVWVAAPPGAGKSLCVSDYLENQQNPCAWLCLEPAHNDPRHLLSELAQKFNVDAAESEADSFHQLIRYFKSHCNTGESFILVLDNVHVLDETARTHQFFADVLLQPDITINLIFLDRCSPPAPYGRMLVNQLMTVVSESQMLFDADETRQLLLLKKIDCEQSARQIQAKSLGWVAGICLLAQEFTRQTPAQLDYMAVLDNYFSNEVCAQCDHVMCRLLMLAAYFQEVSYGVLADIADLPPAQVKTLFAGYLQRHHFVTQGDQPELITLYPLFAEYLRNRFEVEYDSDLARQLKCQIASHLVAEGSLEAAAELYCAEHNWTALIKLMTQYAQTLLMQGQHALLAAWLQRVPSAIVENSGGLIALQGHCLMAADPHQARAKFIQAYQLHRQNGDLAEQLQSWTFIIDTYLMVLDDYSELAQWIDEVRPYYGHHNFADQYSEARFFTALFGSCIHRYGHPHDFEGLLDRCFTILPAVDGNQQVALGALLITHTVISGEVRYVKKLSAMLRGINSYPQATPVSLIIWHIFNAQVGWIGADRELALNHCRKAEVLMQQFQVLPMQNFVYSQFVFTYLFDNQLEQAAHYIALAKPAEGVTRKLDYAQYYQFSGWQKLCRRELPSALDDLKLGMMLSRQACMPVAQACLGILLCFTCIAAGNKKDFEKYFAELCRVLKSFKGYFGSYLMDLIQAYLHYEENRPDQCCQHLSDALAVAEDSGIIDYPGRINWILAPLYSLALEHNIYPDKVKNLIRQQNIAPDNHAMLNPRWPWPVKIHWLGEPAIVLEGDIWQRGKKENYKPLLLLKLLSIHEEALSYQQVIESLWPGIDTDNGQTNLKSVVARLRKIIGKDNIIQQNKRLCLSDEKCWVDNKALRVHLEKISAYALESPELVEQAAKLPVLYPGDFYCHEKDPMSIELYAQDLQRDYFAMLYHGVQACQQQQKNELLETLCRHAIDIDPIREEFYFPLFEQLKVLERFVEINSFYSLYVRALDEKSNASPSHELKDLIEKIF